MLLLVFLVKLWLLGVLVGTRLWNLVPMFIQISPDRARHWLFPFRCSTNFTGGHDQDKAAHVWKHCGEKWSQWRRLYLATTAVLFLSNNWYLIAYLCYAKQSPKRIISLQLSGLYNIYMAVKDTQCSHTTGIFRHKPRLLKSMASPFGPGEPPIL